jgi:hypothetical protein
MERLGADSGKMTLNICKFRIFLNKLGNHIAGFGVGIHPNKDSLIVGICGHRTILAL